MKPVEIEFLMKDRLTPGIDKGKSAIEQLLSVARRGVEQLEQDIISQQKVIDGLRSSLGKMESDLAGLSRGTAQWTTLSNSISLCKEELDGAEAELLQLESRLQTSKKGVDDMTSSFMSLTDEGERSFEDAMNSLSNKGGDGVERLSGRLRLLNDQLTRMRLTGQQNTKEYEDMSAEAARLADTIGDVRRQTQILSDDDASLKGFTAGVNGLSGAFTAATGAVSLFASENENLQKVQARVQSVMAITMGLQQAFNALNKDSAFRLVTVTKVKDLLTAANGRLAAALGISTTAATALTAALTMGLSLVVTGLIVLWNRFSESQERASQKTKEYIEALQGASREYGENHARLSRLKEEWDRLTNNDEKRKWVEANKEEFKQLGISIDDVRDAENVFARNTEVVIESMKLRAKAAAYAALATQKYQEALTNREQASQRRSNPTTGDYVAGILGVGWDFDFSRSIKREANMEADHLATAASVAERAAEDALDRERELKEKAAKLLTAANVRSNQGSGKSDKTGKSDDLKKEEQRASELSKLQEKNLQAELDLKSDGFEKKRLQLKANYDREIKELSDLEKKWRAAQKGELSQDQEAALDDARKLAKSKFDAGEAEIAKEEAEQERVRRRAEIQAMVEYLKEYGSYQQQKLAIAEEYAQKIADVEVSEADEATKQWQKKKLNKERLQKEASLTFENISRGIDWHALFSGVGDLTKEMMVPMMEQLEAFVKTDDYRDADAETQQKVTELIQEMRKYVGTDQSVTWQSLDKAIKDFTAAVAAYDKAKKEEDAAVRAREEGKKRLAAGEITAEEYKKLEARAMELGDATATARANMEAFGNALNRTSEEVANFTSGLTTALNNAKGWTGAEGFGGIQSAVGNIDKLKGTLDSLLPQMGDGMAKTIGTTLSSGIGSTLGSIGNGIGGLLSSGMGSIIGIVAQIPKLILDLANGIKNFVTGILDRATELISLRWIDDLVVSILDAVGNLIDAIFDLPENLYHVLEAIVVNGVGGLLDGVIGRIGNILTFGALSSSASDWFTNSNAEEVAETIDRLTKRNELLEQAIEDLTDEMKSARGASAIDASTRARQLQEETNANYKAIAQAQAGYHSAHHSWNYYWGGYSQEQIDRLSGQIGRQWNGDLWSLSPEEMKMLRSNVDMWEQILTTGKGDYGGRVAEKLNDYIEQAGKLEEITDALYENLTTTTKDNVFDDFLNSLYELADGSEDVMDDIAENWQKMVNKMAVNNLVGAKFQKNLEDWYENLAKLNEARTNNDITDEEYRQRLDALKAEYEGYVGSAKKDIETLRSEGIIQATGENSGVTQSGKAGAFTTMSQDQGTKLEGLFVSGQMHWASMDDKMTDVSVQIGAAGDTLKKIEEHTGSSASSLDEIKNDIKIIKRDGLKVK